MRWIVLVLAALAVGCVKDDYRRWERHCEVRP